MLRSLAAYAVLAAILAAPLPGASASQERDSGAAEPAAGEPLAVFGIFEKAWREGNAQALSAIASDSPILLDVRGLERQGGYFTKAQLYYILKEMFAGTNQMTFRFVKFHNIDERDVRVYGIAQRSYRVKRSGGIFRDKVYVALVREGSRWAVAEIKSAW